MVKISNSQGSNVAFWWLRAPLWTQQSTRNPLDSRHTASYGPFHPPTPEDFRVFPQVFCDHHLRLPRIAFFALRDIEPLEELCYDYGEITPR